MTAHQKILKAINEGIRKSLLSFDDVQFDKSDSNNINQKITSSIKDQQYVLDNFVDLELPSGTLWCKWNIGATHTDDDYDTWYGYHYGYRSNTPFEYTFGLSKLGLSTSFISNISIPSKDQFEELVNNTRHEFVDKYRGIIGLTGMLFIGPNGNRVFFPCAGFIFEMGDAVGKQGWYWSLDEADKVIKGAYCLCFDKGSLNPHMRCSLDFSLSLRSVIVQ